MIEQLHEEFYLQHVQVSDRFEGWSRLEVFREFCDAKKVLHIGCTGWPRTNPSTSLHVELAPDCARLDGYDVHTEAYELLRPLVRNGDFLSALSAAPPYDVILIPEVLEHVANVESFLTEMSALRAKRFIITVPDLFQCFGRHFEYIKKSGSFLEAVHPDHNCWYSPYTLINTIKKYTPWEVRELYWFNKISLLADCAVVP